MQVDLYDGRKTVVVVLLCAFLGLIGQSLIKCS